MFRSSRFACSADDARVRRVSDPGMLKWLDERAPEGGNVTGYDATGWDVNVWILHAMCETAKVPEGITHDDVHQMKRASGLVEPMMIGEVDLEELLADAGAKVVGNAVGRSGWPGPGWQRLRWDELAKRLDVDPFAIGSPPCLRSFPYSSWPIWPRDRSWLVYTDADLWATKVSGSGDLIGRLIADAALETVSLLF